MNPTNQPGLWVALFGPDGAGKSAVIKCLADGSPPPFDAVNQFHFRPKFRRQWKDLPPTVDPHGKPPRGLLISMFKLLYWLADCWFGYLVNYLPARSGSRLVIFDRYLHDILIDPRRYRLPGSCAWFARVAVALAPQPDIYVLLDVPAEIVQRRKAEVSSAESQRQQLAYREMFRSLPNAFVVDASVSVTEVAEGVKAVILKSRTSQELGRAEVSLIADC